MAPSENEFDTLLSPAAQHFRFLGFGFLALENILTFCHVVRWQIVNKFFKKNQLFVVFHVQSPEKVLTSMERNTLIFIYGYSAHTFTWTLLEKKFLHPELLR